MYRMYVDECGTDDIVSCDKLEHRHLALTGVIISLDHVANHATPRLNTLKDKHFPGRDPDGPPIVLHRSDYLPHKGDFHRLEDPVAMANFQNDLFKYLWNLDHAVITVVLDKQAMLKMQHWVNKEPYHYCAEVLAEKFVQFLERRNSTGDVWAESRKARKNKLLQKHFKKACEGGTRYVPEPQRFAERLSTFEIEFREKKHNTTGIQVADTYAKPSMDRILRPRVQGWEVSAFSARFGQLLVDRKYDRSDTGYLSGYGMKFLP